jgi:hypothetical protein
VTELRPSLSGGAQVAGCDLTSLALLWSDENRWPCLTPQITVGSPQDLRSAVAFAATEWNLAFGHSADGSQASSWAPQFPRLRPVADTAGDLTIKWGSGAGILMCGTTDPISDVITVDRTDAVGGTTPCKTNATTDPIVLLVHEFGHALGFNPNSHKDEYGIPAGCTMNLEAVEPDIDGTVCQHEVEYLLASYNYQQIDPGSFWNRPIVTRLVGLPATVTIVRATSVTLSVTHLAFDRQSRGNEAIGGVVVGWESDDEEIAITGFLASASTLVTGEQVGATIVRARTGAGLPSSYLLGARLIALGEPTAVEITSPPPGAFRVTDILGPSTPITSAGNKTFQATVTNPPAGTLQVRWVAIASNGIFDSLDTGYGPNSLTLNVEEGAYNIRVKAYPRVVPVSGAPTYGAYAMEDYPVCTGSGGDNLWGGGGTPDAEEGC